MKVLVIGNGGREHAIVRKLAENEDISKIYCNPGNAGTDSIAENVPLIEQDIINFVKEKNIDLTVVGPEIPLVKGIVNSFNTRNLNIFGPTVEAARLEGSKIYSKNFMQLYNIPMAPFTIFTNPEKAKSWIKKMNQPLVVKVDGLAAGKGVFPCTEPDEALDAVVQIMENKIFGENKNIVIEKFLTGTEVSLMLFSDGKSFIPLESAQDHKREYNNDKGRNSGGMGSYSPTPFLTEDIYKKVISKIVEPTIEGMASFNTPFKGVLYVGLMIEKGEPYVLEYNVRFGDPEAQVLLTRLNTDLVEIMLSCISGNLHKIKLDWKPEASTCVVLAADGYPGTYKKGYHIQGLEDVSKNVAVFHAGTEINNNKIISNGGRVLGITGLGSNLKESIDNTYKEVKKIVSKNTFLKYRTDIGQKGL